MQDSADVKKDFLEERNCYKEIEWSFDRVD